MLGRAMEGGEEGRGRGERTYVHTAHFVHAAAHVAVVHASVAHVAVVHVAVIHVVLCCSSISRMECARICYYCVCCLSC